MRSLESILEQDFQKKRSEKRSLDLNLYLTAPSFSFLSPDEFGNILIDVRSEFESTFDLSFKYNLFSVPDAEPAPKKLKQALDEKVVLIDVNSEKVMDYDDIRSLESKYNVQNDVSRSFFDYQLLLQDEGYMNEAGLHCIILGLEGREDRQTRVIGESIVGEPYFVISLYDRKKKFIEKTLLHELGHCFGAYHSILPFNIMKPETNDFCSFYYWAPSSKFVIRKGIKNYLEKKPEGFKALYFSKSRIYRIP